MTSQDAAELGIYASQLFRYVTEPQQTSVAELMLPIRDVEDENGVRVESALDVGKKLLRSIAATSPVKDGEQRLLIPEVNRVVNLHCMMWQPEPPSRETDAERREREIRDAADNIRQWAIDLPADEERALREAALGEIHECSKYLFKGKTLTTSNTLRLLAWNRRGMGVGA